MTITFELLDPETAYGRDWEADHEKYLRVMAWVDWHKASCVERHGGHEWLAELDSVEEGQGVTVSLFCAHCPAGLDDLLPDGHDLVYGEVDGIPVANGRARTLCGYTAPVNVRVIDGFCSHGIPHYREPDPWIEVSSRAA